MKGTIKTYLPEKRYGFIKGDDGKDYFFHESEFQDKSHIENLRDEALVSFEQQATPKGYKAKSCSLINSSEVHTFVVPDEFIASRSNSVKGWDVIEYGRWMVHGTSRDSPDAAKRDVIDNAAKIGANALIGLEYYKTTGSEGAYKYTIHNFRGRAVTLGRKSPKGTYTIKDLSGLNDRAELLKRTLTDQNRVSKSAIKRKRRMVWAVIVVMSFFVIGVAPVLIFFFLIAGFIFGRSINHGSENHDWWLERVYSEP